MDVRIENPDVLLSIRDSFKFCSGQLQPFIQLIHEMLVELKTKMEQLDYKLKNNIEDASRKLNNQNNAYTLCRAMHERSQNNRACTREKWAVRCANNELKIARKVYSEYLQYKSHIDEIIQEATRSLEDVKQITSEHSQKCENYLDQFYGLCNEYVKIQNEYGYYQNHDEKIITNFGSPNIMLDKTRSELVQKLRSILNSFVSETEIMGINWNDNFKVEFYSKSRSKYVVTIEKFIDASESLEYIFVKYPEVEKYLNSVFTGAGINVGGVRFVSFLDIASIIKRETSKILKNDGWGS